MTTTSSFISAKVGNFYLNSCILTRKIPLAIGKYRCNKEDNKDKIEVIKAMMHKLPNRTVKEMLKEQGIKQVQVALDLDMHPSRLNLILNGWLRPNDEVQELLATYLDVDASELFGGE